MKKRKIYISDVTMQYSADKAGYSLSFREKIELAKLLDKLNISVIETAPITDVNTDSLLVKSLSSAVKFSTVAVPLDLSDPSSVSVSWNAVKSAVHPRLQLSMPVSTVQMEYFCHQKPDALLELASKCISSARELCPEVEFVACDFTRSDSGYLRQVVETVVEAGASVVSFSDAAGDMLPDEFYARIKELRELLPAGVKLGVRCSNDLFLADCCAIAAVRAGADEIKTAPFGNFTVSLERFVKILKAKADSCAVSYDVRHTELDRMVNQIKRLCQTNRSKPSPFSEVVTVEKPEICLNVNDDKATVLKAVKKLDYELTPEDADYVYEAFIRIASKNSVVEAKELDAIVASVAFHVPPTYKLDSFVINSGNTITATAHLRVIKDDKVLESVCLGDGPIDAAFQAFEKVMGRHYELDDFQIQAVTEGREAMGETVVRLRHQGKIYSGRGISTDIVGSSIMAYLNAVNKIAYEEKEN